MTAFRFAAFEFRPRLWTGIAALAGIALTLVLAQWQLGRAQYKEDLQKRYELLGRQPAVSVGGRAAGLDDVLLRRVEVRGEFEPRFTVFVDNRVHGHRPGYHPPLPDRRVPEGLRRHEFRPVRVTAVCP